MEKNMIKLVQPQITDLKYRKKLLKDKKTMDFNKINGGLGKRVYNSCMAAITGDGILL